MKVAFFGFGIMEQSGGFEQYCIAASIRLKTLHPEMEISIVTASDRLTEKLQSILSFYFVTRMRQKAVHRESTTRIKQRLRGKVKYVKCDSLQMMKSELKKYDVVYTKNELLELGLIYRFNFGENPKVIASVHTPIYYPYTPSVQARLHNYLYLGWLYKKLLSRTHAIKVQNKDDYELVKNKLGQKNVYLIHHPFDLGMDEPRQPTLATLNLLFANRITEQKGVDVLIKTIENLSNTDAFNQMVFRIAGSGEQKLADQLNVLASKHKNVFYLGQVSSDSMNALYEWSDASIIPSRYETLSQVAVKTGLARSIAISSDIPGPRDVIINDQTGYLLDLSPDAFAQKILDVYELKVNEPDKLQEMGERARVHLKKTFDSETIYNDLYKMIENENAEH